LSEFTRKVENAAILRLTYKLRLKCNDD